MNNEFDPDAYLERIGYTGGLNPCEDTLFGLHQAHTLTVPFENIDVYYKQPISLDPLSLFRKIVTRRLARVGMDFKRDFGPKTHLVLGVETEGKNWLVDVGFGKEGMILPLLLDTTMDQHQFHRMYRLEYHEDWGYILDLKLSDKNLCQYAFTLSSATDSDIVMSNHFSSTWPESLFVTRLLCTRPTKTGRITLTDQHLKIVSDIGIVSEDIKDEAGFALKLNEHSVWNLKKSNLTIIG